MVHFSLCFFHCARMHMQLPVLAVLFLTVAVGNMVSLGATVYYKMHPKPHLS